MIFRYNAPLIQLMLSIYLLPYYEKFERKEHIVLKKITIIGPLAILALSMTACSHNNNVYSKNTVKKNAPVVKAPQTKNYSVKTAIFKSRRAQKKQGSSFTNNLSSAALGRLKHRVRYDGSYVKIGYPWGDVPANMGVCTDVVIRSYRKLGIDLQQQIHRDMSYAFNAYPNLSKWGLSRPDKNIDHRRVYNMQAFFKRQGAALPVTRNPKNYKPGDLVTWMVGPTFPHIGVVVNKRSKADPNRFMIVHNIANGPELEDILFRFPITGHYRYTPAHMKKIPSASQRMFVSNSKRSHKKNYNNSQLVNDAARLMKTHNKASLASQKPSQAKRVIAISNRTKTQANNKNSSQNLKLAQAKLVNLSTAQLSDLLKK